VEQTQFGLVQSALYMKVASDVGTLGMFSEFHQEKGLKSNKDKLLRSCEVGNVLVRNVETSRLIGIFRFRAIQNGVWF
jgi:hypothetical protein